MVSRARARALLLVSTAAPPAVAQVQLSRLDGVVVDAANRPVGGVTVTVSDPLGAHDPARRQPTRAGAS